MGYSGGTTPDPTYANIGDHAEAIRIAFDPTRMSYADLLSMFWESHDACASPISPQYKSAIFYHDEAQRLLAEQTKSEVEAIRGTVYTEIVPLGPFYDAEDYHQKWYLRRHAVLVRDYGLLYPDPSAFVGSTSAARVNGVAGIGSHYTPARLEADLPSFGLSEESNTLLRSLVK